ncbi:hypothetical protein BpHYR1_015977 [Brachionus plicatilis]|uniref:Uncharacterized protein n=1 Tax=Brachionus plicatilis TaxID=10195 RepID=A0A3M7T553_BRAPC|nr:hypothetical protein BpHYR1_015977 [Brachionus plicatilis]
MEGQKLNLSIRSNKLELVSKSKNRYYQRNHIYLGLKSMMKRYIKSKINKHAKASSLWNRSLRSDLAFLIH